jgi:membrane protein CcdC involved in cytochrome C biogenesis
MTDFVAGATMLASAAVALFFYRFWRESGDRLFGIFALAFGVFAVNRLILSVLDETNENRTYVYLVRLAAFVLILVGIVDKNRDTGARR